MEQPVNEEKPGNLESGETTAKGTESTSELKAAKSSLKIYCIFSAIGFVALGPIGYLLADRGDWTHLILVAVFVGGLGVSIWGVVELRGPVVSSLMWGGLCFLLLIKPFGVPYHFIKQEIEQLTDPERLAQIAETHTKKFVRREAVWNKNLQDEARFLRIAKNDPSYEVRIAAVSRLSSNETLIDLALKSPCPEVRRVAISKISNPDILKQVQDNDEVGYVRKAAKSRLNELRE